VRNRVAHDRVHGIPARVARTTATLAILTTALLVAAMGTAAAEPTGVVEERVSTGLAGPVGLLAVLLGVGGLLIGLLRRRRLAAARSTASTKAHSDTTV
jgi:hypothetical protein